MDFIQGNLRRAVFAIPDKEVDVQNGIEALIVGRGMAKGTEYDRETGRVKTSGKESVPDFIFPHLKLCLEVKLAKSGDKLRAIVNADIRAYATRYERQLYIVYDVGTIRDEAEFKRDLESAPGVSVLVVKHLGVIEDSAGNLYGTTYGGGTSGNGVVFKLDTTGKETVLYSFTGGADGAAPFAAVIRDSAGSLYGTTRYGGVSNAGVVFKLDTTGKETVLYRFTGGADGGAPQAGVIRDLAGNLYGTTSQGGASICCGTVFKLDTTGKETVLCSFTGGADGGAPPSKV
jgi:uncharacterized repeat protein (TIGR03803 family)